jgi:hypothetical protein
MSNGSPQTVSCDVRYSTAGNETVARIQARDHVLEIFITRDGFAKSTPRRDSWSLGQIPV